MVPLRDGTDMRCNPLDCFDSRPDYPTELPAFLPYSKLII